MPETDTRSDAHAAAVERYARMLVGAFDLDTLAYGVGGWDASADHDALELAVVCASDELAAACARIDGRFEAAALLAAACSTVCLEPVLTCARTAGVPAALELLADACERHPAASGLDAAAVAAACVWLRGAAARARAAGWATLPARPVSPAGPAACGGWITVPDAMSGNAPVPPAAEQPGSVEDGGYDDDADADDLDEDGWVTPPAFLFGTAADDGWITVSEQATVWRHVPGMWPS